jgi:hemolysin D
MTNQLSTVNNHANGNGSLPKTENETSENLKKPTAPKSGGLQFPSLRASSDQAIILRQSSALSKGIVWTIVGVTTAAVVWASFATMEEVIPATGQLKPLDTVKEVQAPVNGVVKEVLVKDNDEVKKGQTLVILDSTSSAADLLSAQRIKQATMQENQFYRALLQDGLTESELAIAVVKLQLPWQVATLAQNRATLVTENQFYQVLLGNNTVPANLSPDKMARLRIARFELSTRMTAANMEIKQLEKQLLQANAQLVSAKTQLIDDQKIFADLRNRNEQSLIEAKKSLKIEEQILGSVQPLLEEGALAKMQIEKQQQSVNDRYQRLIEQRANGLVEYDKQRQQIQTRLAEIHRLDQEKKRLGNLVDQAKARFVNTNALTEKEIYVDNEKKINELNSQISRAEVTLKYQEIKSPVNGIVFDLKATPGYVTPPNQTVPLLKIVPNDNLVAQVDITNKDIGFVRKGMIADVRIDSFPYSEFGDIKGTVLSVGSDALPPDESHKFYRFPTKIKLDHQFLKTEDREIALQSGMSVTANIKIREKRTVMSLFTDLFTKKIESLETVR